jgi:hypothetical protein
LAPAPAFSAVHGLRSLGSGDIDGSNVVCVTGDLLIGGRRGKFGVVGLRPMPCRLVWQLSRSVDCGKCRYVENPFLQIGGSPSSDVTLDVDIVPPKVIKGKVESTSRSETVHEGPGVSISPFWRS